MTSDDRIRILPCGCRYDVATGVATSLCSFHEGQRGPDDERPDIDELLEEEEPPQDDGPPYTDAVDDEDGMSELRNELFDRPEHGIPQRLADEAAESFGEDL